MKIEELNLKEFEEKYDPLQDDFGEVQFDNFEDAVKYVDENITIEDTNPHKHMKYKYLWTAIDDGELYCFSNGFHLCNRLFYIVCKKPWGTDNHIENGKIHIEVNMQN